MRVSPSRAPMTGNGRPGHASCQRIRATRAKPISRNARAVMAVRRATALWSKGIRAESCIARTLRPGAEGVNKRAGDTAASHPKPFCRLSSQIVKPCPGGFRLSVRAHDAPGPIRALPVLFSTADRGSHHPQFPIRPSRGYSMVRCVRSLPAFQTLCAGLAAAALAWSSLFPGTGVARAAEPPPPWPPTCPASGKGPPTTGSRT